MKRRNKSSDAKPFQFWLILGVFITAALLNLFFLVFAYEPKEFLFWICLAGAAFFLFTAYCWVDPDRYAKYESYGTPILSGLFFLLLVAFGIAALVYYIRKLITGDYVWEELLAAPIALGSIGMLAYITFRFSLQKYSRKKKDTGEKENHENEN